ncbi:NAD-dependent epimerase/dehydratase family protein [Rhabdothermincola salaria]|uniref:NAD-dependent epimerase/dehydratase family protein n=1 Tax=Rhabdothermincola salaria TaxID=2903142 RepID=UPI001E3B6E24|nr:NAD-dependent epimerase/dehydratase family protein [Rhabdothermincola salaria]MCD9624665.1 NAD-dependent epimerase/dehydratase family protein [Rhabdothermincola salaria]
MRVAITGMGGELGTRVATLLETHDEITEIVGVDVEPPRRHLERSHFHRVDPRNRSRMVEVLAAFEPEVLLHMGVYEPNARSSPRSATARTAAGTVAAVDAAREGGSLRHIVMRSGIEVYGRGRHAPERPDESAPPAPTSPFGQSLLHAERVVATGALRADVPAALVRFAPVLGPHFPSPLGRLLRLPAVPVPAFGGGAFCVVHREDAALALVAAVLRGDVDGPVNVVAAGEVSAWDAVRMGGRVPVPVCGLGWQAAKLTTELSSAPLPDHVIELLVKGRLADGGGVEGRLGVVPEHATRDVVRHVHEWGETAWTRSGPSTPSSGAAPAA